MKRTITTILLIALLLFIWGNSMLGQEASQAESGAILNFLVPIFNALFGKDIVTMYLVRRAAHFIEYSCLGILVTSVLGRRRGYKKPSRILDRVLGSLSIGLFVAVIDETIQWFSGRTSSVLDVWLDFAGVLTGTLIVALIVFIHNRGSYHDY